MGVRPADPSSLSATLLLAPTVSNMGVCTVKKLVSWTAWTTLRVAAVVLGADTGKFTHFFTLQGVELK